MLIGEAEKGLVRSLIYELIMMAEKPMTDLSLTISKTLSHNMLSKRTKVF